MVGGCICRTRTHAFCFLSRVAFGRFRPIFADGSGRFELYPFQAMRSFSWFSYYTFPRGGSWHRVPHMLNVVRRTLRRPFLVSRPKENPESGCVRGKSIRARALK